MCTNFTLQLIVFYEPRHFWRNRDHCVQALHTSVLDSSLVLTNCLRRCNQRMAQVSRIVGACSQSSPLHRVRRPRFPPRHVYVCCVHALKLMLSFSIFGWFSLFGCSISACRLCRLFLVQKDRYPCDRRQYLFVLSACPNVNFFLW